MFWRPQVTLLVNERTLLPVLGPLMPTHLGEVLALVQKFVALGELSDDLLGGCDASASLLSSWLPSGASGLFVALDHFKGISAKG
jgi:hypothetical protein